MKTATALILTASVALATLAGALRLGYLPAMSFAWWLVFEAAFFLFLVTVGYFYRSRAREFKVGFILLFQLLVFVVFLNYLPFITLLVTLVITVSVTLWMYYRTVVEFRRRKYA